MKRFTLKSSWMTLLLAAVLSAPLPALAGPGHDHGDAPPAPTDAAPAGLARRTALIAGVVAAVLLALVAAWRLRRGRTAGMGNAQRVEGAA